MPEKTELTNAVVAIAVLSSEELTVGAVGLPVRAGLANGAFVAIELLIVVAKLPSFAIAAAISFNVSSVPGAESIRSETAACTNSVVATCVVFVAAAAVGALGVPVNVGLAISAFAVKSVGVKVKLPVVLLYVRALTPAELLVTDMSVSSIFFRFCT